MKQKIQKALLFIGVIFSWSVADLIYSANYNPGLKIGYQFGRNGGFVVAFENSIVGALYYGTPFAGVVGGVGLNITQKKWIGYWEVEAGYAVFGAAVVGAAFGGQWYMGYHPSFRVFGGMGVYLSYKHLLGTKINEIALIGKYPLSLYGVMDHGTYLFGKKIEHNE